MIYAVRHDTHIEYDAQTRFARFNLRLEPVSWPGQHISDFMLEVTPAPAALLAQNAPFRANVARVIVDEPLYELTVSSRFEVRIDDGMLDMSPEDLPIAEIARRALDIQDMDAMAPCNYLYPSPLVPILPEIGQWAADLLRRDRPVLESALALARLIQAEFTYDPDATEADTPMAEAFAIRRGVCQDFSHVLLSALRWAGLPAAYCSGYLRTLPPPGQPRLIGVDAMHAWVVLWCGPQRGWVGIDPTNGCLAGAGHIVVAIGRDYSDVAPIDGVYVGEGSQRLTTSVDVISLNDQSS